MTKHLSVADIRQRKDSPDKLVMSTAYDATFASLLSGAGVDLLLVGDSLGMVIQGHDTTVPVTLEDMIYHTRAVRRGSTTAHVVGDLPFMSYRVSKEQALISATRMLQEGCAHSVKLEGGVDVADTVGALTSAGIPVMGHIGLTPQHVHAMGGFKVQGKDQEGARRILEDARALCAAGIYSLVLEGIPADLAETITAEVDVPTIGIGAGPKCDGQVLVCYDFLGINMGFKPKFLKTFADLGQEIQNATQQYISEVRDGTFPGPEHSFKSSKRLRVVGDEQTSSQDDNLILYGNID
ncbi:MAG: 3-methyl-2-oxobutanoate hydroxymethyltransferase [Myxococcota bacterium]|nr:3-methyl-2-oxobutanoate hydroxymethyltransferase [Myxococcota bacterium]